MLSDFWPHGEVAQAYGVFNDDLGCANRGTFLIATDGTIADAFVSGGLGEGPGPGALPGGAGPARRLIRPRSAPQSRRRTVTTRP